MSDQRMSDGPYAENPDWTEQSAREAHVPADRCMWCKCSITNNTTVTLSTGEELCRSCAGDLREWKRTRFADILAAPSLEDSIKTALFDDWRELTELLADIHAEDPKLKTLPSRTSNGNEHREHDDASGRDRGGQRT